MPNGEKIERRVKESWRVRACAAALCVGAQVFLGGCAVGMPLALTGAWISSLLSLPFAVWMSVRSRHALEKGMGAFARGKYLLLAMVLLACSAFAVVSLIGFAGQTLAQQARNAWIAGVAVLAIVLCALSGGTGAARLGFALRYLLPALLLGLSLVDVPLRVPVGLFPILGAGALETGIAALAMLFGAAPALMLMLPPPEIARAGERAQRCPVPGARFFAGRVMAGAGVGVILLFLTCSLTTYESIAESSEWGARLRMAAGNQPHEGVLQMLLMTAKLFAMLLLAVNMLCAAQQAIRLAFPTLKEGVSLLIPVLLLIAWLGAQILLGDGVMLLAAPAIALPAALLAAFSGRRRHT